jgi:VanZ family protein
MQPMQTAGAFIKRWGPAIVMMLAIFALSSRPSSQLPNFGWADRLVKKGGHVLGYGALALAYWHALDWKAERIAYAWLLAVLYAMTDEVHQAFVAGRHPSALDVAVFDGFGAAAALWIRKLVAGPISSSHEPE